MKDQDMFAYATWMEKFGGFAKDMTLRDHFAGLAMQSLLADPAVLLEDFPETIKTAYEIADEMLEARK